jgi:acetyl esterase/lipase
VDVDMHIDREVAEALAASPVNSFDFGAIEFSGLPALREAMAAVARPPLPPFPTGVTYRDDIVPGSQDRPDVTVRVYKSDQEQTDGPGILWVHGGGYMFGSGLTEDVRLGRWAADLGAVVVSVDYRLAPEDPYPAPLDDCYAALVWMAGNAGDLGIDTRRIALAGASAGGGLAAALALLARDRGDVPLAYQLLIYPMIDDRNVTPSTQMDTVVWTRAANLLGWRAYLGDAAGTDGVSPFAAAARAADLSGLPPAFIGVGTLDVFRDEDIEYSLRLLDAGVPTELHVYSGAPHGFEAMCPGTSVAQRCQRDIDDALTRALRR